MILNKEQNIKTIYHIGDIHIRKNNDRDEEYETVFQRLIEKIKEDSKNALVICTGDIFSDGLSPTAIILAKKLFIGLSRICDIIVFRGNHDQISKSNPNAIDYLYPILYKLNTKNHIHILDKSGEYIYGNLLFGYTDIYDPQVFQIENETKKIKIGLWHGTIRGSKNDDGRDLSDQSKFTVRDFYGYDYVMLGDIHKMQYVNKEKTMAYCGSLIQQNYGESIESHGFIKWNLVNKTSKHYHINNDYGFVTLEIKKNKVKNDLSWPEKTNLRVIHRDCDDEFIKSTHEKISQQTKIMSYKEEKEQKEFMYGDIKQDGIQEVQDDENTVKTLVNYIKKNENYDDEERKDAKKILESTVKDIKYNYETNKKNIKLKSLIFNNFNVYGGGNCLDYTSMKGIINISGKNGIGKSSVAVHVLLYAIYGLCEDNTIGKYDYVNNKKKEMVTSIILEVNGVIYRIVRRAYFTDKKRNISHFKHTVILYQNNDDISGKDITETNNKIKEIIGDSDTLINLCIMEQKKNSSFLNLSDVEKKNYLCNLLKLDIYNYIHDTLVKEVKTLNIELNERNKRIYLDPKTRKEEKSKLIENDLEEMTEQLKKIDKNEKITNEEYHQINKEKIEKEAKINELKKLDFSKIENNKDILLCMKKYEERTDQLNKEIDKTRIVIEGNKKKIKNFQDTDIDNKKKIFDSQKEKELKKINEEIDDLWKGYVKVEKGIENIQKLDIDMEQLENMKCDTHMKISCLKKENMFVEKRIKKYYTSEKIKNGYQKYLETIEKVKQLETQKKLLIDKLEVLKEKSIQIKGSYDNTKKILKSKQENKNEYQTILNKMNDIEEQNRIYEKNKLKEINVLNEKIQTLMKSYEKVTENPPKKNDNESMTLKKENDKFDHQIKKITREIDELNTQIIDIKESNVEDKYEKLSKKNKLYEDNKNKLENFNKKLKEYLEHAKMLKNHRFNINCEVCMSNDLTKDKIKTDQLIESTRESIKSYQQQIDDMKEVSQKYQQYSHLMEVLRKNKEIQEQCHAKETMKDKIIASMELNKMKIDNLEKEIEMYQINLKRIENNTLIDEKIKKIKKEIKSLQEEKFEKYEEYKQTKNDMEKIKIEINQLTDSLKDYENIIEKIEEMNNELMTLQTEKEKIEKKHYKYLEYGKMYDQNKEDVLVLEKNKNDMEKLNHTKKSLKFKIELLHQKIQKYQSYYDTHKNNQIILDKVNKKKKELEEKQNEICDEYEQYKKINQKNKDLTEELLKTQMQFKDLELKKLDLKQRIEEDKELIMQKEMYDELSGKIVLICEKYKLISKKLEDIKNKKIILHKRIAESENELKNIKDLKAENIITEKQKCINAKIIDTIKNGFVDNLLTKKIIPGFSDKVNGILTSFVNYKIYMVYENKKIIVYKKDTDGGLSSASKLSGYETLMANIAFRLAINNVNKIYKTNFFIMDEAFAFCDENSIAKISNLFDYMKKYYDFIIVVSHNEQIKNYTDIDLPIQTKRGFSYINMINEKNEDKFKPYRDILNMEGL